MRARLNSWAMLDGKAARGVVAPAAMAWRREVTSWVDWGGGARPVETWCRYPVTAAGSVDALLVETPVEAAEAAPAASPTEYAPGPAGEMASMYPASV